jgi:hypothetical protein
MVLYVSCSHRTFVTARAPLCRRRSHSRDLTRALGHILPDLLAQTGFPATLIPVIQKSWMEEAGLFQHSLPLFTCKAHGRKWKLWTCRRLSTFVLPLLVKLQQSTSCLILALISSAYVRRFLPLLGCIPPVRVARPRLTLRSLRRSSPHAQFSCFIFTAF